MDLEKEIVIPKEQEPATLDQIIEEVGCLRKGQVLYARTNFSDRATHTKWRLRKAFPSSNFEVRTRTIENEYYLRILIL